MPSMASLNGGSKQIRLRMNPHSLARLCLQVAGKRQMQKSARFVHEQNATPPAMVVAHLQCNLLWLGKFRMYVPVNEKSAASSLCCVGFKHATLPERERQNRCPSPPTLTDIGSPAPIPSGRLLPVTAARAGRGYRAWPARRTCPSPRRGFSRSAISGRKGASR